MNFEIDLSINQWINKIDINKNNEYLNKLLNLGYMVSYFTNISLNPESTILDPINSLKGECSKTLSGIDSNLTEYSRGVDTLTNKMDNMAEVIITSVSRECCDVRDINSVSQEIMNKLIGNISTSSLKGKIGENYIENVLTSSFPDDIVEVKAQEAHVADMHLTSVQFPKILIESKLYKTTVSTKEIEKFYNDLETTGINYGLFISISSGITGPKRRLEYEQRKGKHIIFIPSAGFERTNIIYGILFLRELSKLNNISNISPDLIEKKTNLIYNSLKHLDSIFENMCSIKTEALKTQSMLKNQFDNLVSNILNTEIKVKNIIQNMKEEISISLSEIDTNYSVLEKDHLDNVINEFIESGNNYNVNIGNSLRLIQSHNLVIHEDKSGDKTKFKITDNTDNIICELKIQKSKATYNFINEGWNFEIKQNQNNITSLSKFIKSIIS